MAATKFSCPECGKVLRPAKPLPAGKRVKCPQCSAMFETQDDELPTRASVSKKSAKSGAKSKPKPAAKPKPAKKTADAKPPANLPIPLAGDDEEGGPATYSFVDGHKDDEPEIDYVPDTSIKDLRGPAQAAVMRPSNYIILLSVIGFLGYLVFAFIILIPIMFPVPKSLDPTSVAVAEKKPEKEEGKEDVGSMFMILDWDLMKMEDDWRPWQITLLIIGCALGMAFCAVTIYGAVQMQTLTSRTWGIVSSVLAMLPLLSTGSFAIICIILTFGLDLLMDREDMIWVFPIWVILGYGPNLGFGIWGLVTLLRPDVIDGYEYEPE